ncbi:MAG: hypothetical protein ACYS7Y_11690 [Planctomycetota bacterium]|jgi:hypothetical protein
MQGRPFTLDEWREEIKKNVPYVDRKTHSHTIITISLGAIERLFGKEEANKAVVDFKLERLGWEQQ